MKLLKELLDIITEKKIPTTVKKASTETAGRKAMNMALQNKTRKAGAMHMAKGGAYVRAKEKQQYRKDLHEDISVD